MDSPSADALPSAAPVADGGNPHPGIPLVVSYGAGVDSTALLIGLAQRGIRPDVVIFADTGSEHPRTYELLPRLDAWLLRVGFPTLTIVRNRAPRAGYASIEQNCTANETLPSQAFRGGKPGGGACSAKWKHEPMDRWLLRAKLADGRSLGHRVRAVGFDAGPRDAKRAAKGSTEAKEHTRDVFWYPLQAWGWTRERCIAEIEAAGLGPVGKSSCWMCPAMRKEELRELARVSPGLLRRAIALESLAMSGKHTRRRLAEGKRVSVLGLGRSYSWESFARAERLLPEYGGPSSVEDASDTASPAALAFLTSRTVLA